MASTTAPAEQPHGDPATVSGARGDDVNQTSNFDHDNQSDASSDQVNEKTPPPPKLTKKQKVQRHCARWWKVHVVVTIVLLAVLLPVLFTVILPAIVQSVVNSQKLPVNGGGLYATSTTGEYKISLDTMLDTPLPATIDPWQLFLYNKETVPFSPFLNVTLPKSHVSGKTPIHLTDQLATVTNTSEFDTWLGRIFDQEEAELSIRGSSTIHLGALHSKPTLNKTLTLPGLRHLSTFHIPDLEFIMPPLANGSNIKGHVVLPNWGSLTIAFGNTTFNLMSGSTKIGMVTVFNVTLEAGKNSTKWVEGRLDFNSLINNLGPVLESQAEPLGRGMIQLNFTGNETLYDGSHVTNVESVLNSRTLTTEMSALTLLSDLASGFLGALGNGTSNGPAPSLISTLTSVLGNQTLIDGVLGHWNQTGSSDSSSKGSKRELEPTPGAFNMLKFGMKLAMAKAKL